MTQKERARLSIKVRQAEENYHSYMEKIADEISELVHTYDSVELANIITSKICDWKVIEFYELVKRRKREESENFDKNT